MIILETKRLLLRRQVIEDLDALWALYCDTAITKYIPDAPRSYKEAREELEWHMHGHPRYPELGLWATIHKESGKFVGRCGLLPWTIGGQREVEVAYTFGREYWGQGLATEAARGILEYGFEHLNLSRLICLIDPENIASQRVAAKIGMTLEKKVDDIDGDNLPTLIYSLNRRNAWSSFQIDLRSRTTPSFPRAFAPACRQALLGPGYGIAGIQNPCQHRAPTVNLDARHAQRASAAKRRARRRHSGTLAPTPTPLRCGDFVRAHGSTAPHV